MSLFPLKDLVVRGGEFFLPRMIYVRQEMRQLFEELQTVPFLTKIVSGSPGIGKSVTCFLTSLFRAWKGEKSVFYFRWTKNLQEPASAFVIRRMEGEAALLNVKFARNIPRNRGPAATFTNLCRDIPDWLEMFVMVDGLLVTEVTFVTYLDTLCTSGSGDKITSEKNAGPLPDWEENKDERRKKIRLGGTTNIVMGAWQMEDMKKAITACCVRDQEQFDQELFDRIYYVTGGRIREAISSYNKKVVSTVLADAVVARVSTTSARLALARTDERSTSNHVDALRSIYRKEKAGVWDEVDIVVDSQYMVRKLHEKVDGEELLSSFHSAKERGYFKASADYFEELMHWKLSQSDAFPSISSSVKSHGSGADCVRMLTATNCYWVPSIPNFVNIDAAIVRPDMHVWCFQYTTGKNHSYKKRKLRSQFLNILNESLGQQVGSATIIFVVPVGTNFSLPDTAGECDTSVVTIDCTNLDTLDKSLYYLIETVATGRSAV